MLSCISTGTNGHGPARTGTNLHCYRSNAPSSLTQFLLGSRGFPGQSGRVRTEVGPGTNIALLVGLAYKQLRPRCEALIKAKGERLPK